MICDSRWGDAWAGGRGHAAPARARARARACARACVCARVRGRRTFGECCVGLVVLSVVLAWLRCRACFRNVENCVQQQ